MNDDIVVDPGICSGKPVIRGSRIMVKNILGMVAGGYTVKDRLKAYPELSRKSIQSALEYAAMAVDEQQVVPQCASGRGFFLTPFKKLAILACHRQNTCILAPG
jgi:uncharacterized protein (DUF433 family)